MQIAKLIIALTLILMVYEDFRYRAITWYYFPLLAIALAIDGFSKVPPIDLGRYMLLNGSFTLIQLLSVTIYFSIKAGRIVKISNRHIGVGDILFLFIIGMAFSPWNFIAFNTIAQISVLIVFGVIQGVTKQGSGRIPYAGALSILLLLVFSSEVLAGSFSLYDDSTLQNLITRVYGY